MRHAWFVPALLAGILLPVAPAGAQIAVPAAQLACHPYQEIARQLGSKYEEAPVSLGLQSNGNVLQVFASPETGTWTIVSMAPSGLACIIAAGKSWESLKPSEIEPAA